MSMDRSLKSAQGLTRHRNVLSRAERIKRLTDEERWEEESSVFGLPKIANRNLKVGKKTKKKEEEGLAEGEAKEEAAQTEATDTKETKETK